MTTAIIVIIYLTSGIIGIKIEVVIFYKSVTNGNKM